MIPSNWYIETEKLIIPDGQWVARLRDENGYLQETGKGRTEIEAIESVYKNFDKSQSFYKNYKRGKK